MTDATYTPRAPEASFGDYYALMKPRVMQLVVFTALVGMLVAPTLPHPFIGFVAVLCIAVGAGASGALNMWWDADIDAVMTRTATRPVPAGRVAPGEALGIGLALSGFSTVLLWLAAGWLPAAILAFTIFFYAVIYSMWLKRSTPLNIVIGGAAGAFPPVIGWAVATGEVTLAPLLMFALIFAWTPPHFWALALFVRSDYGRAGVPMLTETHGRDATRRQIWLYTLPLVAVALGLGLTSIGGPVYLAVALILNALFLRGAWQVSRRTDADCDADAHAAERGLFKLSLTYLFAHFGALLVEAAAPWGNWAWVTTWL
ncbi:MAG: heme o synthase [Paracoccaceae bacterium]